MLAPCKDCPDRVLGCHSVCEKYIAFDKYRKELLAKKSKENRMLSDVLDSNRYNRKKKRW